MILLLLSLLASAAAKNYNAYVTLNSYHFDVLGYGYRAHIDEERHLTIRSPYFHRKWALPLDASVENANVFNDGGIFKVVVPRIKTPSLAGGEVPRGTTVRFKADHVCATFDGTEPICGNPCKNGKNLNNFIVSEDEVIVKLRTCKAAVPPKTTIYHAFDPDVQVQEVQDDVLETKDSFVGRGWLDRHGNERPY